MPTDIVILAPIYGTDYGMSGPGEMCGLVAKSGALHKCAMAAIYGSAVISIKLLDQ